MPSPKVWLIAGRVETSSVDGPGIRAILHTAGCTLKCPGCFNAWTHPTSEGEGRRLVSIDESVRQCLSVSPHLTISGGEPTDQMEALHAALQLYRQLGGQSVVLYSGRTLRYLRNRHPQASIWHRIEDEGLVDTLIDGAYQASRHEVGEWQRGSANQQFHHMTGRYTDADFHGRGVEIRIGDEGQVVVLGFPSDAVLQAVRALGET